MCQALGQSFCAHHPLPTSSLTSNVETVLGCPPLIDEETEAGRHMSPAHGRTPGDLILEPIPGSTSSNYQCLKPYPSMLWVVEHAVLHSLMAWVPLLALTLTGCVTLDKLLNYSVPWFPVK